MNVIVRRLLGASLGIISTIAAVASAISAVHLSSIESIQRSFIKKQNAATTMQTWQSSVADKAASGFRCQRFLGLLADDPKLFSLAWDKDSYILEGKSKQEALKSCLDRENKKSVPELSKLLDSAKVYVAKPVPITDDVSRFVTASALDFLNFTEGVFLQWKYEIADRCIIESQLGIQASDELRKVVAARPDSYTSLSAFFRQYPRTEDVRKSIASCEARWEKERKEADR